MKSRMEKYYTEKPQYNRTTRNANLYKEVYGSYTGLENLPISNNTNEIDLEELQRLVKLSKEPPKRSKEEQIEEVETNRKEENQREYDINKIIANAKNNTKVKEEPKKELTPGYKFLSTLETNEVEEKGNPIRELKQEPIKETTKEEKEEKELYMTRELKFLDKQIEVTREINLLKKQESSPLDLLEDLKPDGNTFISEPVKLEKDSIFNNDTEEESPKKEIKVEPEVKEEVEKNITDIHDLTKENKIITNEKIPILKEGLTDEEIDNDFYTSSYKFSKKDFIDGDYNEEQEKGTNILKIIFLLIAIFALIVGIYYFISKFGMGA